MHQKVPAMSFFKLLMGDECGTLVRVDAGIRKDLPARRGGEGPIKKPCVEPWSLERSATGRTWHRDSVQTLARRA
jgi:hypothetical protein